MLPFILDGQVHLNTFRIDIVDKIQIEIWFCKLFAYAIKVDVVSTGKMMCFMEISISNHKTLSVT